MSMNRLPRVFLGPLEICGFYGGLTRGLRELGALAHFVDISDNSFGYATDQGGHWIMDWYLRALRRLRASSPLPWYVPRRTFALVNYRAGHALLIFWIAFFHDVIVLRSGVGFTSTHIDLKLYRLLNRTVVFIYHGSEARPPYINGGYRDYPADWLIERARTAKEAIDRVTRFATFVVDNPLSGHFHDRSVCIYQAIGNSIDHSKTDGIETTAIAREEVRILHAPSVSAVKGSDRVRAAVQALKDKGYKIDYVELSGVTNRVVMEEIAKSDIIVDELFSDMHGANFALEGCSIGRPTVVGSYAFEEIDRLVPEEFWLPSCRTHPDCVEATLEALVRDAPSRAALGKRAREIALSQASPRAVAERFLRLVNGKAPEGWFYHPDDVRAVSGFGGTEDIIGSMIARVLERGGVPALRLEGKDKLVARLVAFAAEKSRDRAQSLAWAGKA
jgi:hypothetical protein